jgi:Protein of unknown function (DUF3606)
MESRMNHKRYVIDVSKEWHVAWWAEKLGVSVEALLEVMERVGVEANAVEQFLLARQNPGAPSPFALTPPSPHQTQPRTP